MSVLRSLLAACLVSAWSAVALGTEIAAVARQQSTKSPVCSDFLAQLKKKPAYVIFDTCTFMPDRQGKPLRATYHVSGVHAARVEAALRVSLGLNKLKRSCCQWDSPPASFRSARGEDFVISMVSDESMFAKRSQWREIPRFEIVIDLLTEEI